MHFTHFLRIFLPKVLSNFQGRQNRSGFNEVGIVQMIGFLFLEADVFDGNSIALESCQSFHALKQFDEKVATFSSHER